MGKFTNSLQLKTTASRISKAIALSAALSPFVTEARNTDKPTNVVLIVVDDLRPELGCYGVEEIKTPNIDKLSENGVLFKNAYCNVPVSGASRASFLTGVYPKSPHRFMNYSCSASHDIPQAVAISDWFTKNGYYTVSNGKVFHNIDDHASTWSEAPWRRFPDGYGKSWAEYNKFKMWADPSSANYINSKTKRGPYCEAPDVEDDAYTDAYVAAKSVDDLQRLSKQDKPFFLACGFWRPHLPLNAPKRYWDLYDRNEIPVADNFYRSAGLPSQVRGSGESKAYARVDLNNPEMRKEFKHGYYASVSYVDAQIGKVLDEIERLDLYDNTVVILLGDHGWHLGEHTFWGKHNLMREATNVPLIIAAPKAKNGAVSESIVEYVDLFPTLCDLCEIGEPKDQLGGVSVQPILKRPKATVKEYARIQWGQGTNIVNDRYSYAEWKVNDKIKERMLFDHKIDPDENKNVASLPEYKEVVDQLSQEVAEWRANLK